MTQYLYNSYREFCFYSETSAGRLEYIEWALTLPQAEIGLIPADAATYLALYEQNEDGTFSLSPLHQDISPDKFRRDVIEKAQAIAYSKTKLKKRLFDAWSVLKDRYQGKKGEWVFDFDNKCLHHCKPPYRRLQWLLRPYPLEPAGYENQQTNVGTVHLFLDEERVK